MVKKSRKEKIDSKKMNAVSPFASLSTYVKDGPGAVMVSDTLCPVVHIMGT